MSKISCIDVLRTPQQILLKIGLWPTLTITIWDVMKIIFNLLFNLTLITLSIYNILNAIRDRNMKLLNWMVGVLIPIVNYSAKSFTLIINKKCFLSLLDDLGSEVFNSHNDKLSKYIRQTSKLSTLMLKYLAIVSITYLTVASFLPIIINFHMMIPPPFHTGRFDILYRILHFFASIHLGFSSGCFDILLLTLMGLCVAQLNILQDKLKYLWEDVQEFCGHIESMNLIVEHNLKDIVILHELINTLVKKLSVLLSFPLCIQYTCGCMVICNTILQLTILGDKDFANILSICAYSGVTFGQMTAYHWIGNEIIFKSNKIIESCYISKWYKLNVESQMYLLLLMERAKRPLIIKLYNFFYISLHSLGVIVRWAYSVLALIKGRYN